jgi:hypothetical protein
LDYVIWIIQVIRGQNTVSAAAVAAANAWQSYLDENLAKNPNWKPDPSKSIEYVDPMGAYVGSDKTLAKGLLTLVQGNCGDEAAKYKVFQDGKTMEECKARVTVLDAEGHRRMYGPRKIREGAVLM